MRIFQFIILIILVFWGFYSCNNDPLLEIDQATQTIVVDGWIEEGSGANVMLSWNTPYFTNLDSESIRNMVIRFAKVTVYDDDTFEILTLRNNKKNFPPYIYQGFEIVGKAGNDYKLKVEYKNKTIHATTSIPVSVPIDSAWFLLNGKSDSTGSVFISFKDNINDKNYYRTYSQCYKEQHKFYPTLYSTYDDQYFKQSNITLELNKGTEAYIEYEFDINYMLGDSIILKLTTIDEKTFNFWKDYQMEVLNVGNPFATGFSSLHSNVSEQGLGIWAGYGVAYYSIKAK